MSELHEHADVALEDVCPICGATLQDGEPCPGCGYIQEDSDSDSADELADSEDEEED